MSLYLRFRALRFHLHRQRIGRSMILHEYLTHWWLTCWVIRNILLMVLIGWISFSNFFSYKLTTSAFRDLLLDTHYMRISTGQSEHPILLPSHSLLSRQIRYLTWMSRSTSSNSLRWIACLTRYQQVMRILKSRPQRFRSSFPGLLTSR